MNQVTKTLIVDSEDGQGVYTTIQSAVLALTPPTGNGGVIIVERGVYNIEDESDVIKIPSNTTINGITAIPNGWKWDNAFDEETVSIELSESEVTILKDQSLRLDRERNITRPMLSLVKKIDAL